MLQVVGSKLSKHVLGMKFMRKTKDNLDQDTTEQNHRKHFGVKVDLQQKSKVVPDQPSSLADKPSKKGRKRSLSPAVDTSSISSNKVTAIVEETTSYSQCLGYSFGRCSFGGFNPTVEYNVKRGIWKTGFNTVSQESDDDDESKEKDISDEEMAELRANVIGSMSKRFKTKKQRGEAYDSRNNPILEETPSKRRNRQPGWKKKTGGTGGDDEQGGWFNGHGQALRKGGANTNYRDSPPQKKRKFMKPSDD